MRDTYGKVILDRLGKYELEDDIIEYRKQMEPDILAKVYETIDKAKDHITYVNRDFYIVLLIKVERIGQAPRTFVLARRSCPTPVYKQAVWKYHRDSGVLEFLWSIPDQILYYHIVNNAEQYLSDPECKQIAQFVILMESGELLKWVKSENGNKPDARIVMNKESECTIH